MKLLISLFFLFSSVASARSLSCNVTESKDQKEMQSQVILPIGEKLEAQIVTVFGVLKMNFLGDKVRVSLPSSKSTQIVDAQLSARDGDFFRVQMFPIDKKYDYIDMNCTLDGIGAGVTSPTGAACSLVEKAGAQKFETKFEVPPSQNGHDVFNLPELKLVSLSGWVMLYNGMFVDFMQSGVTERSVTSISAWDRPFSVSWFPTQQNILVELRCEPIF
ncbi:MAG: hypothetical protein IPM97_00715 [Bdellovibrionaceae bacterium]|nr:hypothetical protein [Pseudobdellovibrionaceae bacterium]